MREGVSACSEESSYVILVKDLLQDLRLRAVGNDAVDTVLCNLVHGGDLCDHAARSEPGTLAGSKVEHVFRDLLDIGDPDSIRVVLGVGIIQSVNIGQDYEKIGIGEAGNVSREGIVVAESTVVHDLRGGYGVVLVDDGNDAHLEKSLYCICYVGSRELVRDAVLGEKDLAAAV